MRKNVGNSRVGGIDWKPEPLATWGSGKENWLAIELRRDIRCLYS